MQSLVLSPTSANQDLVTNLIAVSAAPRNVTLNQFGITWSALGR